MSLQVHVLLSANYLTIWQVLHPPFMQLLQTTAPSLACMALEGLHEQGRRLKDAPRELSGMLADLQEQGCGVGTVAAAAGDDDVGRMDDEGRLFKVRVAQQGRGRVGIH